MKKNICAVLIILTLLVLGGCVQKTQTGIKMVNGKPYWFYSPSKDGKIGGVGVSGIHVDGTTGQKTLAAQRALEEIARQMGVKVVTYSSLKSSFDNNSSSVSGDTSSFFTSDGKEVKARIEEMWEDPYTHELYIWMVSE